MIEVKVGDTWKPCATGMPRSDGVLVIKLLPPLVGYRYIPRKDWRESFTTKRRAKK